MDPEMALMLIRAATDPAFAAQLDQAGIPPPTQLLAGSMAPPMGLGAGPGSGVPQAPTKKGPINVPFDLGAEINRGRHGPVQMNPPQAINAGPGAYNVPQPDAYNVPMPGAYNVSQPPVDPYGGWGATVNPAMQPAGVGATGLPVTQPGAMPGDDIVAAALAADAARAAQPGGMDVGKAVSALSGLQAPKNVAPIMPHGAPPKAPEVQMAGLKQGSPAIQALMTALLTKGGGTAVPSLGQLVQGAV
jgi:hypothetical protein